MNWRGRVLLWEEYGLFTGTAGSAVTHESPAIKVCLTRDGEFRLRTGPESKWKPYTAALIPAGQTHAIEGDSRSMAMFLLAPEGELGQLLTRSYPTEGITALPTLSDEIRPLLGRFEQPELSGTVGAEAYRAVISAIAANSFPATEAPLLDPRVAQSIEWIRTGRESGILIKDIAAGVDLSESRFSHLFTEQVRVPVRRYLLWLRLRDALHLLASAGSLTETAHSAGFADSAHLTRTFRLSLGIKPSALVRDSTVTSFLP